MHQHLRPASRLCLLLLVLWAAAAAAAPAVAQDEGLVYLRWDTVITLAEDGGYRVEETQTIRFDDEYTSGFAEISREFTSDITILGVSDGAQAYEQRFGSDETGTYVVDRSAENIFVDWFFPATTAGEIRTFVISYEVAGGLFVYAQELRLDWELFPADRSGLPVEAASLTVNFPAPVAPDELYVSVTGPETTTTLGERQVRLETTAPVPDGTAALALLAFPPEIAPAAQVQPWQQAADEAELAFEVEAVTVALAINGDGTVNVTEEQQVSVQAGALYSGFRVLSLRQMDAITTVSVAEGEIAYEQRDNEACPNCFRVAVDPRRADWVTYVNSSGTLVFNPDSFGSIDLIWEFPALVSGDATTFTIAYAALGAIQRLEEGQRLTWTVVPQNNPVVTTAEATVTLPPGVDARQVTVEGNVTELPDGRLLLRHDGPVPAGSGWQITLDLPPDATSATVPLWQEELEARLDEARTAQRLAEEAAAAEAQRVARLRLFFGGLTILLLLGGSLGVFAIWYWRGRDPDPARLVPEVLAEPPSDLPPAIVNFLLEEEATGQGVLSALFHLASLGLLRVQMGAGGERLRFQREFEPELHEGETVETPAGQTVLLPYHLVYLFNLLREALPIGELRTIDSVASRLGPFLPQVYALLGNEADGYFAGRPSLARRRWRNVGQWLAIAGLLAGPILAVLFGGDVGWIALGPAASGMAIGLLLFGVSRVMPQRTLQGAEEAALWEAFEAYLRELRTRSDLTHAQQLVDRHFAYAVALGVADILFTELSALGGSAPVWTRPVVWEDTATRPRLPIPHPLPREISLPTLAGPDSFAGDPGSVPSVTRRGRLSEAEGDPGPGPGGLDALAQQLSGGLNNASGQLTRLLNTAVDAADESPFELVVRGAGTAARLSWKAGTSTARVAAEVLSAMDSGSSGGSGGYRGGGSWSSGSSRSSSRSSRSSSRSSSSRRSSGGRRGFR